MRKNLVVAILLLGILSVRAQEKVMNIMKTDGTTAQTRVAELKQISFLTVDPGNEGLFVKTFDGATAAILFKTNPVVTVSSGKLTVKSDSDNPTQFVIADIAEILFARTTPISEIEGFACELQDGGVLLRGIPEGVEPCVYSIDGRSLPVPPFRGGELRLSRATLGSGVFIVKVGSFSTKIRF